MNDEREIYKGGHHRVVCVASREAGYWPMGRHFVVFEDGRRELDQSRSCVGWFPSCPAYEARLKDDIAKKIKA